MRHFFCIGLTLFLFACSEKAEDPVLANLEQHRGQWLVINYWAQWCSPCIKEIPELNALDHKYEQVTVLGVNYDGATGEDLEQQQDKLGLKFASLESDPAAQLGIPRPIVLPTTLILNPAGQLITTLVGPQTLESLEQALPLTSKGESK